MPNITEKFASRLYQSGKGLAAQFNVFVQWRIDSTMPSGT